MNQLTEKMVILIQKHINSDSFWQNSIQNVIQEMFGTNLIQNTIQYQNFPANSIQNILFNIQKYKNLIQNLKYD